MVLSLIVRGERQARNELLMAAMCPELPLTPAFAASLERSGKFVRQHAHVSFLLVVALFIPISRSHSTCLIISRYKLDVIFKISVFN
jgi:uncharacterized membrane protein